MLTVVTDDMKALPMYAVCVDRLSAAVCSVSTWEVRQQPQPVDKTAWPAAVSACQPAQSHLVTEGMCTHTHIQLLCV